jgi:3-hydroxyacyl-CoA dehydrogenase
MTHNLDTPRTASVDGIRVITLEHPPLNVLASAVRRRLADDLHAALADEAVKAIVLTGAGAAFCGGGDITEFDGPAIWQEPSPGTLMALVEDSPKPVVAALHGVALGGGLELSMACHARVAQAQTAVGLPEVHLGFVPGAGGTQRLPRLIGLELATDLIVHGRKRTARDLADSGLFDLVTDEPPLPTAIDLARRLAADVAAGGSLRRTGRLPVQMDNAQAFLAFARGAIKSRPELLGPSACLDCLEDAATKPFQEGLAREVERFHRLRLSPQSEGLRHAFQAERQAAKVRGLASEVKPRPVSRTAVIGGGTMGTGIAMSLANAGLPVTLVERDTAVLDRALATVRKTYEDAQRRGRLGAEEAAHRVGLVSGALTYEPLREADLIIEAVFEDMAVKRQVFEQLDAVARPGAVLATNTSMLDVDEIATFTRRPQDVLGLHFFSPAHVMALVEVVRGAQTAPDALATAMALTRRLSKTAVVSGVCEGFIGNRMLQPYLVQAGLLLEEGALPQQVDRAIERWGMAMGPFRMCDMAGNDLSAKIRAQYLERHPDVPYSQLVQTLADMGRLGQKVGRGWYDHIPGQRAPVPSSEVQAAIEAHSQRLGLVRRRIDDEEIVERLSLALVNEGAYLMEEGIVQRVSDIDVVFIAGYGFPRWRGGPMFVAGRRGLDDVVATMHRLAAGGPAYQRRYEAWRPAPLLTRMAERRLGWSSLTEESAA